MNFHGGCQCGHTRYTAQGPVTLSSICYCRMCQRAAGAPFMAFLRFPATAITWSRPPAIFASSNKVERGFCQDCGTPLTYRELDGPNLSVTRNSLDDPSAAPPPTTRFFAEQMPDWLTRLDSLADASWHLATSPGFIDNQSRS